MKKYLLLFVALCVFIGVLPASASAATLSLGGPAGATVGGTFNVPVLLSTAAGESANAVSATVTFPSGLVSLVAVSKAGSIISLWPSEPTQTANSVHFEGVILNPGYTGQGGTVITLTFQAKTPGEAALAFQDATILANDGNATPILTSASPKTVTIQDAGQTTPATSIVITSTTHPNQNATYASGDVSLHWTLDSGATEVRIGYDKDPVGRPTVVYDATTVQKQITLRNGTWYFHVQDKVGGVWSSVATFRIKIGAASAAPEQQTTPAAASATTTATSSEAVVPMEGSITEEQPQETNYAWYSPLLNNTYLQLLALALLALLLALLFVLSRYWMGYPSLFGHKRSRKSIAHAQLHEQFEALRDALTEEIFALQHAKTKRDLTDEEERFISRFDKLLNRVESNIERELLK